MRRLIFLVAVFLLLATSCGGGGEKSASSDAADVNEAVDNSGPVLDFDVSKDSESNTTDTTTESETDTTASALLFGGLSADTDDDDDLDAAMDGEDKEGEDKEVSTATTSETVTSSAPTTTAAKEKLIFIAPQSCLSTPTGGSSEKFVEALYRNCLYRPIVADSNQYWVKKINDGEHKPEWVRDVGVHRSPESRCLLGEAEHQDRCPDNKNEISDVMAKYDVVCDADSFASAPIYSSRAAQRIKTLCPEANFQEVD